MTYALSSVETFHLLSGFIEIQPRVLVLLIAGHATPGETHIESHGCYTTLNEEWISSLRAETDGCERGLAAMSPVAACGLGALLLQSAHTRNRELVPLLSQLCQCGMISSLREHIAASTYLW